LAGSFAFVGIGVACDEDVFYASATSGGIVADETSIFRVASVSKIVTAAAFEVAAGEAGLTRPYDIDAREILGFDLRNPVFPHLPITAGMLMTHTAGIIDHADLIGPEMRLNKLKMAQMFGAFAPGQSFHYSNFGYVLLAACAEKLSGRRFDEIVNTDILAPRGVVGGFNWSGMTTDDRSKFLPTFRRDGKRFLPQIDAVHPADFTCSDYVLGQSTARLSPQGGLRTSLEGMLGLAVAGSGVEREPLWRQSDGPGDYLDGLFEDYGAGEQLLPRPTFYPRPLIGHFGNAYGFNGGVWHDQEAGLSFVYALNGVPLGDESDALSRSELEVFKLMSTL